jgi:hypothetical protein
MIIIKQQSLFKNKRKIELYGLIYRFTLKISILFLTKFQLFSVFYKWIVDFIQKEKIYP